MPDNEDRMTNLNFDASVRKQVDSIKNIRLNYWFDANNVLRDIDRHRVAGAPVNDRVFRSYVLALYRSVRSQLKRRKTEECVVRLNELELDNYYLNPQDFKMETALESFLLLTDFLELTQVV